MTDNIKDRSLLPLFFLLTSCALLWFHSATAAEPGQIVTRVWDDRNGNGRQNEAANIADVPINLLDSSGNVVDTAFTNNAGLATFTISAGTYRLEYVLPADHAFTIRDAAGVPDDKDSDARPNNGRTDTFTVGEGETITTWDAGLWAPGRLEARAWDDRNGNGRQNEGANIAGVTVNLLESNNAPVINPNTNTAVSGLTDASGIAQLDYVPADRLVKLEFILPVDHAFTPRDVDGVPDDKDSDARPNNGRTDTFQADRGSQLFTTWDAGVWAPGRVQARAWDDRNGNGRQNEGANVAGVTVNLLESDNSPLINPNTNTAVSGITNGSGVAELDYVPADRPVKLEFVLPVDHAFTPRDVDGVPDDKDSDARPNNGRTDTFQADRGSQLFTTWDAGVWTPGSVQARVWDDRDGNGRQNEGANIAGVTVNLLESNNTPVINPHTNTAVSGVTNSSGVAELDYVPADRSLKLEFVLPADHLFTTRDADGVPDDKDSDARPNNGRTDTFQADRGNQTFNTWDAGVWAPGQIQARVWEDKNEDGRQNEGANVAGVQVRLLDNSNNPIVRPASLGGGDVTAVTGSDGLALLDYVPADQTVKLEFVLPANYKFTIRDAGGVPDDKDSDARPNNGRTDTFQVTRGSHTITDWDAGAIYESPTAVSLSRLQAGSAEHSVDMSVLALLAGLLLSLTTAVVSKQRSAKAT